MRVVPIGEKIVVKRLDAESKTVGRHSLARHSERETQARARVVGRRRQTAKRWTSSGSGGRRRGSGLVFELGWIGSRCRRRRASDHE